MSACHAAGRKPIDFETYRTEEARQQLDPAGPTPNLHDHEDRNEERPEGCPFFSSFAVKDVNKASSFYGTKLGPDVRDG